MSDEEYRLAVVAFDQSLRNSLVSAVCSYPDWEEPKWSACGFGTTREVIASLQHRTYHAAMVEVEIGRPSEFDSILEKMLGLGTIVVAMSGQLYWNQTAVRQKYGIATYAIPFDYTDVMAEIEKRMGR